MRSFILLSLSLTALFFTGCASDSTHLQMVSIDGKRDFKQKFSEAYACKTPTGDTDIVLISQVDYSTNQDPRKPLRPLASPLSPRQIVHIRVYWKPPVGTKADHPANTNASIHWYMMEDSAPQADYVEYSGSGFADVDESDNTYSLNVHRAWMKVANHRGVMCDPLGPSQLNGSIQAIVDPSQVQAVLAEVKTASTPVMEAHAPQPTTEPARMSVGQ
jgi:hypothetical protein